MRLTPALFKYSHRFLATPRRAMYDVYKKHVFCYIMLPWCRTQAVRGRSAKPLCTGSNPVGTLMREDAPHLQAGPRFPRSGRHLYVQRSWTIRTSRLCFAQSGRHLHARKRAMPASRAASCGPVGTLMRMARHTCGQLLTSQICLWFCAGQTDKIE